MPVNSFENYPMSWRPKLKRGKKALYLTIAKQLEEKKQLQAMHRIM